jgi:hypothetical protein
VRVEWKLRSFLQAHHITPNALAEHIKGQVSKNAVYNLVAKEPPVGVNFKTLETLVPALAEMTREKVSLSDILELAPATPEPAWMRLAGALDDPDSPGDISLRHDHYIDEAINAEHEESVRGER